MITQAQQAAYAYLGVDRETYLHGLTDLYALLVQSPYPSGAIITEAISMRFPLLPQRVVYHYTQMMKKSIAEIEQKERPTLPITLPTHGNS